MMRSEMSAKEIVKLNLPGFPGTERSIIRKAKRDKWQSFWKKTPTGQPTEST